MNLSACGHPKQISALAARNPNVSTPNESKRGRRTVNSPGPAQGVSDHELVKVKIQQFNNNLNNDKNSWAFFLNNDKNSCWNRAFSFFLVENARAYEGSPKGPLGPGIKDNSDNFFQARHRKSIPKSISFFLRFGSDYNAKMVPKSTPKPTPRRSKNDLETDTPKT